MQTQIAHSQLDYTCNTAYIIYPTRKWFLICGAHYARSYNRNRQIISTVQHNLLRQTFRQRVSVRMSTYQLLLYYAHRLVVQIFAHIDHRVRVYLRTITLKKYVKHLFFIEQNH